ncbi:MAG: neuraminidase-like domain-containing protein, partial [Anaerolineales bacterium]
NTDYLISAHGWLNALPVNGDPPPLTAVALLKPFQGLLDYARIKAALAPNDERLLSVLQDPAALLPNGDGALLTLTRWDSASLTALLNQFGGNTAGLAHLELFRRVYDAFALLRKTGIPGTALIRATTNEPDGETARGLQSALRARYAAADWRDVIQPINDELRGLQRDALVAWILHQMRSNPSSAQIDTADKLFEYFLMDVQMEPCMQTSRIRHALSSVQLFIERCFMNLEPRVSPATLTAKQWEWMKRYRVWEANRKVYLFPENWLEPELRDDKSPFFKEIESELLQSDITDDSAATALLNYLSKLEEVAKLEPCGIYHQQGDPVKRTDDIDHVVARTAGAHRKYYYRRKEGTSWTPWEQIKLDIEDNPVVPVVWNDRLLLFWLRILKKGPDTTQKPTNTGDFSTITVTNLPSDPKLTVEAVLCWSEYYNGKWQPTKTSDVNQPTFLVDSSALNPFDRSNINLNTSVENDALRIQIVGGNGSFLLYNTHSLPVRGEEASKQPLIRSNKNRIFTGDYETNFGFEYSSYHSHNPLTRDILKTKTPFPFEYIKTRQGHATDWDAPFFYEDRRHVFYVTTATAPISVVDHSPYGVANTPDLSQAANIPPLVFQIDPHIELGPKFWGDGGPVGPDPSVIDRSGMLKYVTEDAYIHLGIGAATAVQYGDQQIGPSGAIPQANIAMQGGNYA